MTQYYGAHRLSDFRPSLSGADENNAVNPGASCGRKSVVVGAVAHHVPEDSAISELSVIFDNASEEPFIADASIVDVIAASADAPFYFETPAMIGET